MAVKTKQLFRNQAGITHVVAPLAVLALAVIMAVGFQVANHTDGAAKLTASATPPYTGRTNQSGTIPTKTVDNGMLLLYSNGGLYKKAVIAAYGQTLSPTTAKNLQCKGRFFYPGDSWQKPTTYTQQDPLVFTLPANHPYTMRCTPGNYAVYFLKKGQSFKAVNYKNIKLYVAVGVSKNYCSFLHREGIALTQPLNANGVCDASDTPSQLAIVKQTPRITFKGTKYVIGKPYVATDELTLANGDPLSPLECAGSLIIHANRGGERAKKEGPTLTNELPVRYSAKTKSCIYQAKVPASYTKTELTGTTDGVAQFTGSTYLNPVSISYHIDYVKP